MPSPDFLITVGVSTSGSASDNSKDIIANDIKEIFNDINKKPFSVKIQLDQKSVEEARKEIQTQLSDFIKKNPISVTIDRPTFSDGFAQAIKDYVNKQLRQLQIAPAINFKATLDSSGLKAGIAEEHAYQSAVKDTDAALNQQGKTAQSTAGAIVQGAKQKQKAEQDAESQAKKTSEAIAQGAKASKDAADATLSSTKAGVKAQKEQQDSAKKTSSVIKQQVADLSHAVQSESDLGKVRSSVAQQGKKDSDALTGSIKEQTSALKEQVGAQSSASKQSSQSSAQQQSQIKETTQALQQQGDIAGQAVGAAAKAAEQGSKAQDQLKKGVSSSTNEIKKQADLAEESSKAILKMAYTNYQKNGGTKNLDDKQFEQYAKILDTSKKIKESFQNASNTFSNPRLFESLLDQLDRFSTANGGISEEKLIQGFSQSVISQMSMATGETDKFVNSITEAANAFEQFYQYCGRKTSMRTVGEAFKYIKENATDTQKSVLGVSEGMASFIRNLKGLQVDLPQVFGAYDKDKPLDANSRLSPNKVYRKQSFRKDETTGQFKMTDKAIEQIREYLVYVDDAINKVIESYGKVGQLNIYDFIAIKDSRGIEQAIRYINLLSIAIGNLNDAKTNALKKTLGEEAFNKMMSPVFKNEPPQQPKPAEKTGPATPAPPIASDVSSTVSGINDITSATEQQTLAIQENTEAKNANRAAGSELFNGLDLTNLVQKGLDKYRQISGEELIFSTDQIVEFNECLAQSEVLAKAFALAVERIPTDFGLAQLFDALDNYNVNNVSVSDTIAQFGDILTGEISYDKGISYEVTDLNIAGQALYDFYSKIKSKELYTAGNAFKYIKENCDDTTQEVFKIDEGFQGFISTLRSLSGFFPKLTGPIGTNITESTLLTPTMKGLKGTVKKKGLNDDLEAEFNKMAKSFSKENGQSTFSYDELISRFAGNVDAARIANVVIGAVGTITNDQISLINAAADALYRLADAEATVQDTGVSTTTVTPVSTIDTTKSTTSTTNQPSASTMTPVTPEMQAAQEAEQALEAYEVVKARFEQRLSELNGNVPTQAPTGLEALRDTLNSMPELAALTVKSLDAAFSPDLANNLLSPIERVQQELITSEQAISEIVSIIESQFKITLPDVGAADKDVIELVKVLTKPGLIKGKSGQQLQGSVEDIYEYIKNNGTKVQKDIFKVNQGLEEFKNILDEIVKRKGVFDSLELNGGIIGINKTKEKTRLDVEKDKRVAADYYEGLRKKAGSNVIDVRDIGNVKSEYVLNALNNLAYEQKGVSISSLIGEGGLKDLLVQLDTSKLSLSDFFKSTYELAKSYVQKITVLDNELREYEARTGMGSTSGGMMQTLSGRLIDRSRFRDQDYELLLKDAEARRLLPSMTEKAKEILAKTVGGSNSHIEEEIAKVMAQRVDLVPYIEKAFSYSLSSLTNENLANYFGRLNITNLPSEEVSKGLSDIIGSQANITHDIVNTSKLSDNVMLNELINFINTTSSEGINVSAFFDSLVNGSNNAEKNLFRLGEGLEYATGELRELLRQAGVKFTGEDMLQTLIGGRDGKAGAISNLNALLTKRPATLGSGGLKAAPKDYETDILSRLIRSGNVGLVRSLSGNNSKMTYTVQDLQALLGQDLDTEAKKSVQREINSKTKEIPLESLMSFDAEAARRAILSLNNEKSAITDVGTASEQAAQSQSKFKEQNDQVTQSAISAAKALNSQIEAQNKLAGQTVAGNTAPVTAPPVTTIPPVTDSSATPPSNTAGLAVLDAYVQLQSMGGPQIDTEQLIKYGQILAQNTTLLEGFQQATSAAFSGNIISSFFNTLDQYSSGAIDELTALRKISDAVYEQISIDLGTEPAFSSSIIEIARVFENFYSNNPGKQGVWTVGDAFEWMRQNCDESEKSLLKLDNGFDQFLTNVRGMQGVLPAAIGHIGTDIGKDTTLLPNLDRLGKTLNSNDPMGRLSTNWERYKYFGQYNANEIDILKKEPKTKWRDNVINLLRAKTAGLTTEDIKLIENTSIALDKLARSAQIARDSLKTVSVSDTSTAQVNPEVPKEEAEAHKENMQAIKEETEAKRENAVATPQLSAGAEAAKEEADAARQTTDALKEENAARQELTEEQQRAANVAKGLLVTYSKSGGKSAVPSQDQLSDKFAQFPGLREAVERGLFVIRRDNNKGTRDENFDALIEALNNNANNRLSEQDAIRKIQDIVRNYLNISIPESQFSGKSIARDPTNSLYQKMVGSKNIETIKQPANIFGSFYKSTKDSSLYTVQNAFEYIKKNGTTTQQSILGVNKDIDSFISRLQRLQAILPSVFGKFTPDLNKNSPLNPNMQDLDKNLAGLNNKNKTTASEFLIRKNQDLLAGLRKTLGQGPTGDLSADVYKLMNIFNGDNWEVANRIIAEIFFNLSNISKIQLNDLIRFINADYKDGSTAVLEGAVKKTNEFADAQTKQAAASREAAGAAREKNEAESVVTPVGEDKTSQLVSEADAHKQVTQSIVEETGARTENKAASQDTVAPLQSIQAETNAHKNQTDAIRQETVAQKDLAAAQQQSSKAESDLTSDSVIRQFYQKANDYKGNRKTPLTIGGYKNALTSNPDLLRPLSIAISNVQDESGLKTIISTLKMVRDDATKAGEAIIQLNSLSGKSQPKVVAQVTNQLEEQTKQQEDAARVSEEFAERQEKSAARQASAVDSQIKSHQKLQEQISKPIQTPVQQQQPIVVPQPAAQQPVTTGGSGSVPETIGEIRALYLQVKQEIESNPIVIKLVADSSVQNVTAILNEVATQISNKTISVPFSIDVGSITVNTPKDLNTANLVASVNEVVKDAAKEVSLNLTDIGINVDDKVRQALSGQLIELLLQVSKDAPFRMEIQKLDVKTNDTTKKALGDALQAVLNEVTQKQNFNFTIKNLNLNKSFSESAKTAIQGVLDEITINAPAKLGDSLSESIQTQLTDLSKMSDFAIRVNKVILTNNALDDLKKQLGVAGVVSQRDPNLEVKQVNATTGKTDVDLWTTPLRSQLSGMMRTITQMRPAIMDPDGVTLLDTLMGNVVKQFTKLEDKVSVIDGVDQEFIEWCNTTNQENAELQRTLTLFSLVADKIKINPDLQDYLKTFNSYRNEVYKMLFGQDALAMGQDPNAFKNGNFNKLSQFRGNLTTITQSLDVSDLNQFTMIEDAQKYILARIADLQALKAQIQELFNENVGFYPTDKSTAASDVRNAFSIANARASALQTAKTNAERRLEGGNLTNAESAQYQRIIEQVNTLLQLYNSLTTAKYKTGEAASEAASGFMSQSEAAMSLIKLLPRMTSAERDSAKEATKVKTILSSLSGPLSTLDKAITALENGSASKGSEKRVNNLRDSFLSIKADMQDALSTTTNTTDAKNTADILRRRIAVAIGNSNQLVASPYNNAQIDEISKSINSNLTSALSLGLNKKEIGQYDDLERRMQAWLLTTQQMSSATKERIQEIIEEGRQIQAETERLNNNSNARKNNIRIDLEKQPGVARFRSVRNMATRIIEEPNKNGKESDMADAIKRQLVQLEMEYLKFNQQTGSTATEQRQLTEAFIKQLEVIEQLMGAYPALTAAERETLKANEILSGANTSRRGARNALDSIDRSTLNKGQTENVDKLNAQYLNAVADLENARRSDIGQEAAATTVRSAKETFDRIRAEVLAIQDKVEAERVYKEAVDASTEASIKQSAVIQQLGDSTSKIRDGLVDLYSGKLSTEAPEGERSEAERASSLVSSYKDLLQMRQEIFSRMSKAPDQGGYKTEDELQIAVNAYVSLTEEIANETEQLRINSQEARKNAEIQARLSGAKNVNASLRSQLASLTSMDSSKIANNEDGTNPLDIAIQKIMDAQTEYNKLTTTKFETPEEAKAAAEAFLSVARAAQEAVDKVQGQSSRMQIAAKALFGPIVTEAQKLSIEFNKVSGMGLDDKVLEGFKKKHQELLDLISSASIYSKGSITGENAIQSPVDLSINLRNALNELAQYIEQLRASTTEEQNRANAEKAAAEEDGRRTAKLNELSNAIKFLQKNLNQIDGRILEKLINEKDITDLETWKQALSDASAEISRLKAQGSSMSAVDLASDVNKAVAAIQPSIEGSSTLIRTTKAAEKEGTLGTNAEIRGAKSYEQGRLSSALAAYQKQLKEVNKLAPADDPTIKGFVEAFSNAVTKAEQKLDEFKAKAFDSKQAVQDMAKEIDGLLANIQAPSEKASEAVNANVNSYKSTVDKLKADIKEIDSYMRGINKSAYKEDHTTERDAIKAEYDKLIAQRDAYVSKGTSGFTDTAAFNNETNAIKANIAALKERAKKLYDNTEGVRQRTKLEKQATELQKRTNAAINNYTAARYGRSSDSYEELKTYATDIQTLISEISTGKGEVGQFSTRLTQLQANVAKATNGIIAAHENTKTFGERIAGLARQFSYWFSATRIIMSVVRSIRQLITTSIELEDKMTQLKIVTQQTSSEYADYMDNITKVAHETGTAISDLVDSTTTFARLGYNLDESSMLAQYTGMLKNVGM